LAPDGNETLIWEGTQAESNKRQPTDSGTFVITATGKNLVTRADESLIGTFVQGSCSHIFTPVED